MDIQAARAKRSSMPNVPPPPISARMTATGGKHRPEKPLRKLPQLAKSSREDQPCRSLRKLPVNQSHESPSPLHKSIRKFVHAPLYASTDTPVTEPSPARSGGSPSISLRAHLYATGGCIFRKRALRGPRALPFGFPPFRGSLPAGPGVLAAPLGTPCRRAEAPHPAARADHERSRSRWRSTICPSPT